MSQAINLCVCGRQGLLEMVRLSWYQVKCECGRKSPTMSQNETIEYWNTMNVQGRPTQVRIPYHELLDDYKKMMDDGVLEVFSIDIDHKRGCYVLTVRWL